MKKLQILLHNYANDLKTSIFSIYRILHYYPTKLTPRILFKFIFYVEYSVVVTCNSSMVPNGRLFFVIYLLFKCANQRIRCIKDDEKGLNCFFFDRIFLYIFTRDLKNLIGSLLSLFRKHTNMTRITGPESLWVYINPSGEFLWNFKLRFFIILALYEA